LRGSPLHIETLLKVELIRAAWGEWRGFPELYCFWIGLGRLEKVDMLLSLLFPKSVLFVIGLWWALAAVLAGIGIFERLKGRNAFTVRTILRNMFPLALVPSALTVIVHVVAVYLLRFANQLDATTRNEILVAVVVVLWGLLAYVMKLKKPFWYGLVEVIASVLFVISAVANSDPAQPNHLAIVSAILAAVYVVVRGLANMTEGSLGKVETFDQFIEKLSAKLGIQASRAVSSSPQSHQ